MVKVMGKCPMGCLGESLFLAEGGHVTCSWIECPDPSAADRLLRGDATPVESSVKQHDNPQADRTEAVRTMVERCVCEHGRWAHAEGKGRCFASNCPCQAFAPSADEMPLAPETVQLAGRFIEGAQMLERVGEDKGEKAMRRARRLADGMRLQAITVALGLEEPRV